MTPQERGRASVGRAIEDQPSDVALRYTHLFGGAIGYATDHTDAELGAYVRAQIDEVRARSVRQVAW